MTRRESVVVFVVAGVAIVVAFVLLVYYQDSLDLRVYRAGGQSWLDETPLYADSFAQRYGTKGLPFTYPPVAAIVFTAFAALPWVAAIVVMGVVSFAALVGVAMLVVRRPAALVVVTVAGGALLEPVRLTLNFGQINLVLMVLVVADCLVPRTWWPRGMLIGLAAAIKLTPFAFLLFFAVRRQWRPMIVTIVTFAGVTLVAGLLSPGATPAYLSTVLGDPERVGALAYTSNQSLSGFWHRFGLNGSLTTDLWLLSAFVVVVLGWQAVRRTTSIGDDLGALVATAITGLLISPVSWSHHWVWAVLAGVWIVPRLRTWQWPGRIAAVVGLLLFAAPPHWVLPHRHDLESHWAWWQHIVGNEYTWLGLTLLVVLARPSVARWTRRRTPAAVQEPARRS